MFGPTRDSDWGYAGSGHRKAGDGLRYVSTRPRRGPTRSTPAQALTYAVTMAAFLAALVVLVLVLR